jgi:hypothetical protein
VGFEKKGASFFQVRVTSGSAMYASVAVRGLVPVGSRTVSWMKVGTMDCDGFPESIKLLKCRIPSSGENIRSEFTPMCLREHGNDIDNLQRRCSFHTNTGIDQSRRVR